MLILLVLIFELILGAFYNGVSIYFFDSGFFPPVGLFGLVFLSWFAPEIWALVAIFFLGLLADTNCGTPCGVYLIAYLVVFFLIIFFKSLLPAQSAFYFVLTSLVSLLVIQLVSSLVYLAALESISLDTINFSWVPFALTAVIAVPFFMLLSKIKLSLNIED